MRGDVLASPLRADCEHGHHVALVAHPPIVSPTHVEVDHVCPLCGAVEYTVSYTAAAWAKELARRPRRVSHA